MYLFSKQECENLRNNKKNILEEKYQNLIHAGEMKGICDSVFEFGEIIAKWRSIYSK